MTYRKEQTRLTLYQRYTMMYR